MGRCAHVARGPAVFPALAGLPEAEARLAAEWIVLVEVDGPWLAAVTEFALHL